MANTFTFLYPYIDKMIQEVDFEQLAPLTVFDKDLEPAGGVTGRIPRTKKATVAEFTPSMVADSGSGLTISGSNYTVDQCYESTFSFFYTNGGGLGARSQEVIAAATQECVRAVLKAIESGFFASGTVGSYYSPGCPNKVGAPAVAPFGTPWADLVNLNTALDRNLCPQDGRVGVVDLNAWGNLLNATGLTNFYASNSDQTLRSAKIGKLFNYDVVMDTLIPTRTSTGSGHTGGATTEVASGAIASGDNSFYLVRSGTATGAAPMPGDIFWFTGATSQPTTGYGQSYVITSGTALTETGAAGTNGILQYFYPVFRGSGTTLVNVEFGTSGAARRNIFGHKSAYRLVMRDPRQGMGGLPTLGENILYIDPRTGVPLLITIQPGDLMATVKVKALWTWVAVKPEWSCILEGL